MTKYVFLKDADEQTWIALPRKFKKGEIIHKYNGYDYGCSKDDLVLGGVETIACSLDGEIPFFTVPVSLIEEVK